MDDFEVQMYGGCDRNEIEPVRGTCRRPNTQPRHATRVYRSASRTRRTVQGDPKEQRFAEKFNHENARWESPIVLRSDEPHLFRIPIRRPAAGFGYLSFRCEASLGDGDTILVFNVPVGDANPEAKAGVLES